MYLAEKLQVSLLSHTSISIQLFALQTHSELESSQKQNSSLQQQLQDVHLHNNNLQQHIGKYSYL